MAKVCVLVVEDKEDLVELMKLVFEGEGYNVSTAEDGAQAIELLQHFHPAVIVTDLMMPRVTGVELIKYVRGAQGLAQIPIIAISAARDGLLNEARLAGATEAVSKPVDFDELVGMIGKYAPVHPGERETRELGEAHE